MEKYKVIYSPEVAERLLDVAAYLKQKWSKSVADNFLLIFFEKIQRLQANPEIGRIAERDNSVRSISITKHDRLYYQFYNDLIKLLSLIDTRQNPSKNKFE